MSEKNLEYWQQKLSRLPLLELPTDKSRSSNQNYQVGIETFIFSQGLCKSLNNINKKSDNKLFIILLAAFKCLLYKYTSQEDIIVGSYIPQSDYLDFNTLAFRSFVSGDISFVELLHQVNQVVTEDLEHQDVSWEQLVQISATDTQNDSGIFQVMFSLQDAQIETPLPINVDKFALDISLFVVESQEGLKGTIVYNQELFEPQTIKRMIGHFENLLQAIIENPDRKVNELTILSKIERHQILVEWNQTAFDYPRDKCIHQLFEEQVVKTPNNTALVYQNQKFTYDELNIKANQLAYHLRSLRLKPQIPIGIYLQRSTEAIISILAILKAGGTYIPLDPAYPQERLTFMLKDAQVEVLITDSKTSPPTPLLTKERGEAQLYRGEVINLDTDWEIIAQNSTENLINLTKPENLAYIMYTSGSTGIPKGVCVLHRGVVRLVKSSNYVNLSASEIILQAAPISFDASTLEIWGALLNGGKLVVLPIQQPSLKELGEILEKYQISTLWLTAGLFHLMVDEQIQSFKGVRQLLAGGDIISPIHAQKLQQTHPNCQLINGYGPTENTTFTCCYSVPKTHPANKPLPIGYPISNTQVYILDSQLQPVAIGVAGELYISGDGLARGYLNRPELTAEKFIPNPFIPGMRMYKTGDLARFLPDGKIDFFGRIDHQVKIRGFRIELGEIETVLNQHSAVKEAVVIPQEYEVGDKRLIAYIVPRNQTALTNKELRNFLQSRLPQYMIPSGFVTLAALPLTPNDKVDRRSLPKPDKANLNLEEKYLSASNDVEQKLVRLWEQTFRIQPIGIQDNFFSLGGNSLMATSIVAEIEKIFDKKLSPGILFEASTIEELAAIIAQKKEISLPAIKINFNGSKPPLFIIANSGFLYQKIIDNLDAQQPVYIIQEPLDKVPEMASRCLQQIRNIQPTGSYHLLGHSYEGLVTYEIARQLCAENEQVVFLGMIDTPTPEVENQANNAELWYKRYQRLKTVLGFSWKDKTSFFKERIDYKLSKSFEPLMPTLEKFMNEYEVKSYPGKITIFSAVLEFYGLEDINFGWDKWAAGGVEVHEIPGTHRSMLLKPENAELFANKLRGCLTK
ncbi:amino acid adenylation domain-containing protein [Rivularia sp. UHCC 0363]|uniref:non-ribosomal peptide synthetase n=1 Tax=Rivularia sp. UHCC 0363 TaxID=3110244 RepID=UPI002B220FA2|nr:amino acid adenylation domain-containing protein [Rivularia sp. UHCC 0363]MEA5593109.1 amino acid adenylation domain-containing protein [Rivularia sp. UHCC 0363]